MFAALNIDRNNIQNAVADNMLDDLGITHADYNIGQTISRVGVLVAELPWQLLSKRIGPDMWISIQLCIFSLISAMPFFLKGRASFLATRYLIATFQDGFTPDTILYFSYSYTGTRLLTRLAWFWMSSQLVGIGVGFAAVGMLSIGGMLGYEGWRWLFLIEGAFTLLIGVASFFLMPQSPARTKSRWNPKGYFTEHEQKIIFNSGLSIRQIWEYTNDYDMWPLYALGLLFGLPKYPVNQYLTLSFRGLGFNVIESNLLSIPYIVGSCITMLAITAFSELYRVRYFKANTGLLVICAWMCLIQYPWTFFYHRWRNNQKAKKWDEMTPEEQHQYRTTTTDKGNKRLDFRFAT
ncbi:mfs general substrate transporter [Fusarium sp. NRRL 52700]|nr:mfs general substrate transporter [Fusarium sp. NRRL 52700]